MTLGDVGASPTVGGQMPSMTMSGGSNTSATVPPPAAGRSFTLTLC